VTTLFLLTSHSGSVINSIPDGDSKTLQSWHLRVSPPDASAIPRVSGARQRFLIQSPRRANLVRRPQDPQWTDRWGLLLSDLG